MSVSKIQRAWDKAWEWADIKFSKKILISQFAEGGTLTQWKGETGLNILILSAGMDACH